MSPWISLPIGIALTLVGWILPRVVAGAVSMRPIETVMIDAAVPWLGFACLVEMTGKPIFSGVVIFSAFGGLAFADVVKREVLREPIVFTDMSEAVELFRHPELYLPFAGTGRVLVGAGAAAAAFLAILYFEPAPWPWSAWRAVLALAAVVIVVVAIELRFRPHLVARFRHFDVTGDMLADARTLGPLAMLLIHGMIARTERSARCAAVAPVPDVTRHPSTALPPVVLLQCESFFDPRRLHPGIASDLLAEFDECRRTGTQWGRLLVPSWGANTTRTEFSVLTGLSGDAIGLDRFNPYHAFARRPVDSLAWRLKAEGYRTICVHPFDRTFYRRDLVLPNLGFDVFLGEEAFAGAARNGAYVTDRGVGQLCADLLRDERDGAGIFLFAITMENHGPWQPSAITPGVEDVLPGMTDVKNEGLRQYLHAIRSSDTMLGIVRRYLEESRSRGVLGFYGDHLPSFPMTFDTLGFHDQDSDYVIWRSDAGAGGRKDLASHDLCGELLRTLRETLNETSRVA